LRARERPLSRHSRLRPQVDPCANLVERNKQRSLRSRLLRIQAAVAAVIVQRPLGRLPGLGFAPGGLAGSIGEAAICRFCAALSSVTGMSATMSPLLSPDLTSVIASLVTPSTTTRHAKPPSGCCTATWSLPSNRTTDAFGRVSTLSSSLTLISARAVIPGRRAGCRSSIRTLVVWNLLSVLTNEVASGNGALPVVRQPDPL